MHMVTDFETVERKKLNTHCSSTGWS